MVVRKVGTECVVDVFFVLGNCVIGLLFVLVDGETNWHACNDGSFDSPRGMCGCASCPGMFLY